MFCEVFNFKQSLDVSILVFIDVENYQRVVFFVCVSSLDDGDGGVNGGVFIYSDIEVRGQEDWRIVVDVGDVYVNVQGVRFWRVFIILG